MGNSSSSPAPTPSKDSSVLHDHPVSTHKSLRSKKKSLELPDLASLSLSSSPYHSGRGRIPAKSPCIPIPQVNNPHAHYLSEPRPRPQNNFSSDLLVTEPPFRSSVNPALLAPQPNGSANRPFVGAQPPRAYQYTPNHRYQQKMGVDHLQHLYKESHQTPAPPPSSADPARIHPSSSRHIKSFVPEVVHSSVPIGLLKGAADENELVPVKITWRGGGKSVALARAGDNDWKGRQVMERVSPTSQVYSIIANLPCGTHHFRFLVDDQWRVADDLPTAVDDQGTLANYVAVPLSVSPPKSASSTTAPPPLPPQSHRPIPGQSFWSATSSADGDIPEPPRLLHHSSSLSYHAAVWTSEIPSELVEAAKEEEAYLQASAGQYEANDSRGGGKTYVNGFVPAPNIPPAPGLPRHLDKLILNSRMSPAPGSTTPSKASTSGKTKGKDKDKSDRDGRRHRDGGEKYKRVPPPPPPPSEDGSGSGLLDLIPADDGSSPTPEPNDATPSTVPARLRPIGIDPSNNPSLTDDGSVLSVPSHVVLHHLCTSAIRNGVLAVANTTRYREKYLTTVYYKPT